MKLVIIRSSQDRIPKAWLTKWFNGLARKLKVKRPELVLVFATRLQIRKLNQRYRGKGYATDVLSFASIEDSCLGELVFCMSVIKAQSKRTGLSERGELGYMAIHGMLHLLGYDHEKSKQRKKMFALQDELYAFLEKSVGLR